MVTKKARPVLNGRASIERPKAPERFPAVGAFRASGGYMTRFVRFCQASASLTAWRESSGFRPHVTPKLSNKHPLLLRGFYIHIRAREGRVFPVFFRVFSSPHFWRILKGERRPENAYFQGGWRKSVSAFFRGFSRFIPLFFRFLGFISRWRFSSWRAWF